MLGAGVTGVDSGFSVGILSKMLLRGRWYQTRPDPSSALYPAVFSGNVGPMHDFKPALILCLLASASAAVAAPQTTSPVEILAQGRKELCPEVQKAALPKGPVWTKLSTQAREAIALGLAADAEKCGWGKAVVYNEADAEFGMYRPESKLRHIGAFFERRGAKWFVSRVIPGMTAAEAGLKRGDELVAANGKAFDPFMSFQGQSVSLKWRREPWSKFVVKTMPVSIASAERVFDEWGDRSWLLFERGNKRIASLAVPKVPAAMTTLVERLKIAQNVADALILDLRGGVAEETKGLLPLFLESESGKEKPLFTKPILVLVDGKTAGTREWLASFLQEQNRGFLIGTETAGAFAPRTEKVFGDGKWLVRVPVPEKTVPAAEGKGLKPDIEVKDEVVYAGGRDEAWERAVQAVLEMDQGSKETSG